MPRNFKDPAPSAPARDNLCNPPGGKGGSLPCRASGKDGHKKGTLICSLVPRREPSLNTGACLGFLSEQGWPSGRGVVPQLGQDPGGAHVRNGARCPLSKGSGNTYFMITSDSLSTGFSSGLQGEETRNQGALHWGSDPTPEAQRESSAL